MIFYCFRHIAEGMNANIMKLVCLLTVIIISEVTVVNGLRRICDMCVIP